MNMLTSLKAMLLPGIAPASTTTGDAAAGEGTDFAAMMHDAAAPLPPEPSFIAAVPAAAISNPDPALENGPALPEGIADEPADRTPTPSIRPTPLPTLSAPQPGTPPDDEAALTQETGAASPSVSAHPKNVLAIHDGSRASKDEAVIAGPDEGTDDLAEEDTSTAPDQPSAAQPALPVPSIVVVPVPPSTDASMAQQVEQGPPASMPTAPAIAGVSQSPVAMEEPQAAPDPSPTTHFETAAAQPVKETQPASMPAVPANATVSQGQNPVERPQAPPALPPAVPSDAPVAESSSKPVAAVPSDMSGPKVPAPAVVPTGAFLSSADPEMPARAAAPPTVKATDAPAAPRRSMSEVMSLLQLARDQLHNRDAAARAAVVDGKADTPPVHSGATVDDAAPPMIATPSATPQPVVQAVNALPTVDLSAALGTQLVDMGVSGQWIDGLARDIARFSADGAQGRFQIDAGQLGPVQVDILQSQDGAAVSLTVASEKAEQMLRQESDRLRTDTSLSAVRITDVKIERGHPIAEAARSESGNSAASQPQGQNPGWGQSSTQSHMQGRGQGRENFGSGAKAHGDAVVLKSEQAGVNAPDLPRARYA